MDFEVPALTIVVISASLQLPAEAVRALPVGTAYAVWTGMGADGTVIFLGEPRTAARMVCIALILPGSVGPKLTARA